MFLAAAQTIAELSPAKHDARANLFPPLAALRQVSLQVAIAVAKQAEAEGLARPTPDQDLAATVKSLMWEPLYPIYRRVAPAQRG
jgi:malate dehydrogenase (oxaloacetate-decarboxylating)